MSDVLTEGDSPLKLDRETDEGISPMIGGEHLGYKKHVYDPHEPHSA
jgi:hypothetical protein